MQAKLYGKTTAGSTKRGLNHDTTRTGWRKRTSPLKKQQSASSLLIWQHSSFRVNQLLQHNSSCTNLLVNAQCVKLSTYVYVCLMWRLKGSTDTSLFSPIIFHGWRMILQKPWILLHFPPISWIFQFFSVYKCVSQSLLTRLRKSQNTSLFVLTFSNLNFLCLYFNYTLWSPGIAIEEVKCLVLAI